MIAHTDSTAGKSMATRFGTGKKTKHVDLRFLYVQNLVQMGLLRKAKIEGVRNPADLMTKYVATDVLQRLITHLGVGSNWFKGNAPSDANDADDHVAALNAHCMPRPPTRARFSPYCACVRSTAHTVRRCSYGRRWTEVPVEGPCHRCLVLSCLMNVRWSRLLVMNCIALLVSLKSSKPKKERVSDSK